ncbi:4Fe-4S dicluster domain-containing protein [Eggerthella lenta]|uniref:4Fe-4S dicluster domain-containing protein n=1 Tax=Eggerthella lenta TaxID=84112 RepID=UPI000DF825AE|nr:4Fe-4S dicluster domain-containing protein [Eggerthella lenta]RDC06282.1 4Fe-4S ferredoxin [Eggerthella lenta]
MTHYGMAIDLKRCIGCHACAVACKMSNNLPKNVQFNRVNTVGGDDIDTAAGSYPNNTMSFLPVQCQHCENPACLEVCPTGATTKDEETGIVSVDSELCIGCESCIKACPYEGVRTLIKSPEYYLDVVVGEYDAPPHKGGTVEKCTFCKNLIDRGEVPACMQLCPGRARYWGDLDDPESDVSKAIEGRETMFLNEEAGTKPSVYYLQ